MKFNSAVIFLVSASTATAFNSPNPGSSFVGSSKFGLRPMTGRSQEERATYGSSDRASYVKAPHTLRPAAPLLLNA
jgi:hypothetical protein